MKQLFTFLFFLPAFCLAQTPSITITSSTLPSTSCVGSTITVSYTSTGSFSPGTGASLFLIGPNGTGYDSAIGFNSTTSPDGALTGTIPASLQTISGEYSIVVRRYSAPYGFEVSSAPITFTLTITKTPTVPYGGNGPAYCLNDVAVSLANSVTATGPLNWYTSSTGGPASSEAPIPPTSQLGSKLYYVSQTENGCESPRTGIAAFVANCNYSQGYQAGDANTSGSFNTFLGTRAGRDNISGTSNVFLGFMAGARNTTASANVFIGHQAGINNTTGIANMFLGQQAGANSNGSYNLFMGNGSGNRNTDGNGNTAIGDGALYNSTIGTENTAIGRYAGINNTIGSYNTFIGVAATTLPGSGTLTNSTAIGWNSAVSASNALILGNNQVNVGIGNTAPNNKLEITKGSANQSGLRFTNLTSSSPATLLSQTKFLAVNETGDVVMASSTGSAREGVAETLWQRKGSFLQSTQNDAVIIGEGVNKTSSEYNLFVSKGILTEKVKIAVKNTSDWSDYVFGDTYQLKGLSEVEKFIQTNKHLPGVPSASDVVEQGIDVAKMDAKLLEKIEELTLYSIQLEKTNQQLQQNDKKQQKEIDELKSLVKQLLHKK